MKLAIVGASGPKWSEAGEQAARRAIKQLIEAHNFDCRPEIVSGACPKGGVDIWAEEIGREWGLPVTEFRADVSTWKSLPGLKGFRERNVQIAEYADAVCCLVPDRFYIALEDLLVQDFCRHCQEPHTKSGGCWTVQYALKLGKPGRVFVVSNG